MNKKSNYENRIFVFKEILFLIILFTILTSCATQKSITVDDILVSFKNAGLEAENSYTMTKDDYGFTPYLCKGTRFLIPSLGEDKGGRVFICENNDDRDQLRLYYVKLGESSAAFYSWTFIQDKVLVQINGNLPDDTAKKYEMAFASVFDGSTISIQPSNTVDVSKLQTVSAETAVAGISLTSTAQAPTLTPTRVPYSQLDLSRYLDIPTTILNDYDSGQITNDSFEQFDDFPKAEYTISQELKSAGQNVGGVSVFVFNTSELASAAFDSIQKGFGETPISVADDGTYKMGFDYTYQEINTYQGNTGLRLQVVSCNVVYYIRLLFVGSTHVSEITKYIGTIKSRIEKEVYCPGVTLYPTSTPTPVFTATPTIEPLYAPRYDGFYLVGVDIAPGLWRSSGESDHCYWSLTTKTGDIINNHFGMAGGTVYIPETAFQVEFRDCDEWTYLGK